MNLPVTITKGSNCLLLVAVKVSLLSLSDNNNVQLYEQFVCCILQMVFSSYTKLRILHYDSKGFKAYTIARLLEKNDGIRVSRFGVSKFLKVYRTTGTISRQPGSGRLSKITAQVKEMVEAKMLEDDETTATQLHQMLLENGIDISLKTILRCHAVLGWTFGEAATAN